jgi:hypothetical protein
MSAASPATSGNEEALEHATGTPRHRLEHGQPEALVEGRIDEHVGYLPEPLQLLAGEPVEEAKILLHAGGDSALAQATATSRTSPRPER